MNVRLYSMTHIGLIGQGLMARVYARRCSAIPGIEVTTETDTQCVSGAVYDDDPDVVFICSPPDSHHSMVKTAADQGIDVFCQPPIASTVEKADAIRDIVRDAGIVFVPGHVCRIAPEYVTAKERIDGEIGSLGNARTFRQLHTDHWIASRDRRTDVVSGLAFHDIDFLRWTCGEVERVFTRQATHDGDAYVLITLRFANAIGHIDARLSKRSDLSFVRRFELAGNDGLIEFDSEESSPVTITRTDDATNGNPFETTLPKDPHQLLVEHVIDCVERNVEPIVSIEESIKSLRVELAALASIEKGAPVAIEEIFE